MIFKNYLFLSVNNYIMSNYSPERKRKRSLRGGSPCKGTYADTAYNRKNNRVGKPCEKTRKLSYPRRETPPKAKSRTPPKKNSSPKRKSSSSLLDAVLKNGEPIKLARKKFYPRRETPPKAKSPQAQPKLYLPGLGPQKARYVWSKNDEFNDLFSEQRITDAILSNGQVIKLAEFKREKQDYYGEKSEPKPEYHYLSVAHTYWGDDKSYRSVHVNDNGEVNTDTMYGKGEELSLEEYTFVKWVKPNLNEEDEKAYEVFLHRKFAE